jgi:quinol monooxygenase YgiN
MIIVSGSIRTDPAARDDYVVGCREVIEQARRAPGCVDFHITADPIELDRINIYEQWASVADVEAFRGSGSSSEQQAAIREAEVYQHVVESSERL